MILTNETPVTKDRENATKRSGQNGLPHPYYRATKAHPPDRSRLHFALQRRRRRKPEEPV